MANEIRKIIIAGQQVELSTEKKPVKEESIKNDSMINSVFQKFNKADENGNVDDVLDENELNALEQQLLEAAGEDMELSEDEARGFLEKLGINDVNTDKFFSFIRSALGGNSPVSLNNTEKSENSKVEGDKIATSQAETGEKADTDYNKNVEKLKQADKLAKQFYQIADDYPSVASLPRMKKFLEENITKDNIVEFLEAYQNSENRKGDSSAIHTLLDEVGAAKKEQKDALMMIMEKLCEAATEAGVSPTDIANAKADFVASLKREQNTDDAMGFMEKFKGAFRKSNPQDMEKAVEFLLGAIEAKRTENVDDISDKEAIQLFNELAQTENEQAQRVYDQAKGEGWSLSARMGDTICGWFGCNTIEEMEAKLGKNTDAAKLLLSAKTEEEFKTYFLQVSGGVEFDAKKIAAAEASKNNLAIAQGLSNSIKTYNQILNKSGGQTLSEFEKSVKSGLNMDEEQLNALTNTIYSGCKTDAEKKQALSHYLRMAQDVISTEYKNLTKGKTLEQMSQDVKLISQSALGKMVIQKDSEQFTSNMATTEMVTDIAGDIALTVALSAIPGGAAWATTRMAGTAAKWGVKGAKLADALNKTANGFNKIKQFEQGTTWVAQAKRGDTGAKVANVAAKTVSSAGNAAAGTAIYEASATNHSAEEIREKCLANGVYGAIGAGASDLAPKLMAAFKIDNAFATELAEEIINAAGSVGFEGLKGGEYGTGDATMDIVSGILIARLSHVGTGGAKVKSGGAEVNADSPKVSVDEKATPLAQTKNSVKNNGTTMTFEQMTERLKNGHVNYTILKTEDGRKLIRIENSTKAFSSDRFDYYEFDGSGNMVKSQTQISENTAKGEFKDFENASSVNIRNRGGRLNVGLPVMDAAEGIDAKVTSSNIRKEIGDINNPNSAVPTKVLTDSEIELLEDATKFPEATQETFNVIAQKIKEGEIPSREMFGEVLSEVSGRTGIEPMALRRDFAKGVQWLGPEWTPIDNALKKSKDQNIEAINQGSLGKKLTKFKEKKGLLSPDEMQAKQETDLKAQQNAELKAKQEAELKAKEEAELQARREAEKQAEIEAEKAKAEKIEKFAQK